MIYLRSHNCVNGREVKNQIIITVSTLKYSTETVGILRRIFEEIGEMLSFKYPALKFSTTMCCSNFWKHAAQALLCSTFTSIPLQSILISPLFRKSLSSDWIQRATSVRRFSKWITSLVLRTRLKRRDHLFSARLTALGHREYSILLRLYQYVLSRLLQWEWWSL